ncbi:hypothetical protein CAEBREN_08171 [Caenorhabditis brenneri]|uniref:Uncharacterized protein n=1 Tax=Caenorhabditis brenneri TaxID=135651 RepID=G0MBI9_CAEBE|nr:hypothetical protein CAEBREN_08171 [Caenorhabditis brenneri]
MIFHLFLLALLVVSISSEIDCSTKGSCFGEPHNCDPVSDCQSLIQFDDSGNLVLLLRNFTEINEYAAIPIRRYPDETIEFLLCVPLQQKYLRVRAEMDEFVLSTDEILNSLTPITSQDYCQCYFDSAHLPENFRTESSFTVSRGNIDGLAIINDGVLLHPVNANLDFEDGLEGIEGEIPSEFDCSTKDTYFGVPHNCDSVSDCQSLIQFDDSGNLVFLLRNFTEINEYAAIPIRRYPDETIEFLLCVPLQQKYLRVRAEMDGLVLSTDEILNSLTPITSRTYSKCYFDSSHLPENFRTESSFTVLRGNIDGLAIINDGVLLHPVNANLDFEDDSEEVDLFSTYYFLGRPVQEETVENNGWWRYVRSPSNSDVDSQNVIEDEKRKSNIQMNTESSTGEKDVKMHAEASQTTMGTIDHQITPQSQESNDHSNAVKSNCSSPSSTTEARLIKEHFHTNNGQGKQANSDTAKSVAGAIGLVSLFAMMRASTEEEIEAERQAQGQQIYTEVAIDRPNSSQQNQASLPAGASSPTSSSSTSSDGSATSSPSYSPSESSSQSDDEESQEDDEVQQTVVSIKKPGPTPTKRPSSSPDNCGPSQKSSRKL